VKIESSDKDAAVFYTIDGSEPNENSLRYDKPFIFNKNGVIKAISYDAESNNKSTVAIKELDLSHDFFNIIEPKEGTRKIIDANIYSTMYIDNNEPLTFEFNEEHTICGFRYLPNQSRDASRHIVDYELYIDGKLIKSGTFGNIKNNPIEQVVRFEEIKGKTVTFVPTRNTDGSRNCGIAEFSIITK
jgi:alpha-L-fucosidase